MRKLNGINWLFALAIISATANADVIIDNQSIPSADINGISITPNSGDLYITTIPGYTVSKVVVGENVAITSFSVSPSTILAGGSATLSWSTANADTCTASDGVGDWAGSVGTSGPQNITTSLEGTHTFTLTCSGPVGDDAVSSVNLTVNSATAVAITSFSALPSTITEGDSTTLSWATQNADSCVASGANGVDGWAGTVATQSAGTEITIDTSGVYAFTLTCVDVEGGEAVSSSIVTVDEASLCSTPELDGNIQEWSSLWLVNFPKPTYDNRYVTIPRFGYHAIRFNTGNILSNGRISTIETTVTDGVRLGAISECPGDFDVEPECDHVWGISGGINWTTVGRDGSCELQPNTDYYVNLTYTDGENASSTTCFSSPCITNVQHINR
jgi:hypothetical protein